MKIPKLLISAMIISIVVFFASCKKDDSAQNGNTAIKFKGIYNPNMLAKSSTLNGVAIETVTINIEEIEFDFDDDNYNNGLNYSEIKLKGPFEINLVENGMGMVVTLFDDLVLPETGYDEIEFKFDKNENSASDLYNKSVLIKGTIDGIPFIFYTDEEFEMEIEFDNAFNLSEVENAIVSVSFDLQALFDPAFGGIDITSAQDGNGNGVIEIIEDDTDGNKDLADKIADRLDDIIEAFEDDGDDD